VAEFAHKLRALGKRYEFDMIALVKKTPGTSEGVFVFRERLSQAAGFDVVVVESDSQGILDNKDVSGRKIAILCEHIDNGEHIKSANGCLSDRGAQVVLALAILSIKSNAIDEIKKQTGIPVVDTLLKKTWYEYIGSREAA
jgi:phosphoribosylpyrophosphate synthetase